MAREYAPVRLSVWADDTFRSLTPRAQHLYFVLLTSSTLSFCGVADWRPKRLAALSAGNSSGSVEQAAAELSTAGLVVIDEETEEVLLKTFIREDGLMKQPNMAVAMVAAYTAVASGKLRAVVAEEVRQLSIDQPELACWGAKSCKDALARIIEQAGGNPSVNPSRNPSANPSVDPSGTPSSDPSGNPSEGFGEPIADPSGKGSVHPSATPAPAPSSKNRNKTQAPTSPEEPPASGALFDVPPRPETEGQRVNRLARIYTDRIKLTSFHGVSGIVKVAIRAEVDGVRQYSDTQIAKALSLLADENRTVTANSLRVALEGQPPPGQRPVNGRQAPRHVDAGLARDAPPPEYDPVRERMLAKQREGSADRG